LWAKLRFEAEHSYEGYLDDLGMLWRHVEGECDLAPCLQCALIASTITTLAERTVPELLAGLVEVGARGKRWPAALAVSYIETMSDPVVRARAIAKLAALEVDVDVKMPFDRLLEIAGRIDSPTCVASRFARWRRGYPTHSLSDRARVLAAVATHNPEVEAQLAEAVVASADAGDFEYVLPALQNLVDPMERGSVRVHGSSGTNPASSSRLPSSPWLGGPRTTSRWARSSAHARIRARRGSWRSLGWHADSPNVEIRPRRSTVLRSSHSRTCATRSSTAITYASSPRRFP
jgi:hypothetical protein